MYAVQRERACGPTGHHSPRRGRPHPHGLPAVLAFWRLFEAPECVFARLSSLPPGHVHRRVRGFSQLPRQAPLDVCRRPRRHAVQGVVPRSLEFVRRRAENHPLPGLRKERRREAAPVHVRLVRDAVQHGKLREVPAARGPYSRHRARRGPPRPRPGVAFARGGNRVRGHRREQDRRRRVRERLPRSLPW